MDGGLNNHSLKNYNLDYYINMSRARIRNIKHLNKLSKIARGDAIPKVNQIIKLYSENKINQIRTAENLIIDLIYNMKNKKKQASITKKYDKLVDKHKSKEKTFYVSGKIHLVKTTTKTNKKGETKTHTWRDSIVDGRTIKATTKEKAT